MEEDGEGKDEAECHLGVDERHERVGDEEDDDEGEDDGQKDAEAGVGVVDVVGFEEDA